MIAKIILILILIVFCHIPGFAQRSNERSRVVREFNRPLKLDSLSIVPGSVMLTGNNDVSVEHDIDRGTVSFLTSNKYDSLLVRYTVFPYDFAGIIQSRHQRAEDSAVAGTRIAEEKPFVIKEKKEELFYTDKVQKSGILSRGISFGNRQDIFVNSVLNLQLEGELSDQLNIRASITDQNIPYQPEGNTRLVQDFDNVFFEIYNRNLSLSGGDIVLKNGPSDFLRFHRNVQGVALNTSYSVLERSLASTSLSYSASKGKFFSYRVEVIDGVMGPYKLYGPEGNSFLIIIANSERVYVDGRLMERGFNNDYVIDYNTAEITFTSKVLITRFSRVNIDFEYTNQGYSRSVVNFNHTQQTEGLKVSVQYYQEKDNRNQPLLNDMSDQDKIELSRIDPAVSANGFLTGWDSVGYSDTRILYEKSDTLTVDGEEITIFKFSNDPDRAHYQVYFSEAAEGKGAYVRVNSQLNGQYYEWAGKGKGRYLPLRSMPLPDAKQMLSLRAAYDLNHDYSVFTELGLSKQDHNLFNESGEEPVGLAVKSGVSANERPLEFLPGYVYSGKVTYEFNSVDFNGIDRYRQIEYDRNWGINATYDTLRSSDKILTFSSKIHKDQKNFVMMDITNRNRTHSVNGWQVNNDAGIDFRRLNLVGNFFHMNNVSEYQESGWIRYQLNSYLKFRYFFPGYQYSVDRNQVKLSASDSIVSSLMNFEEHSFYIKNNDTLETRFNLSYSIRKDKLPFQGKMEDGHLARTVRMMAGTNEGKLGRVEFNMSYRETDLLYKVEDNSEKALLGRIDWYADALDNHIRSEISYAVGNSRELKREYVYMQVPAGEGTHTWRDDDQDGIRDIHEFYPAINPDERDFIKLFTPTDEYVLAYDNQLNYRLQARMPRSWLKKGGLRNFAARFSNNLSVHLKQKVSEDHFKDHLLFHNRNMPEEQLISYHDNIRNVLYFNQADPDYGFDLIYHKLRNKQLMADGFESRKKNSAKLISRLNLNHDYHVRIIYGQSETGSSSDYLEGRNYRIHTREAGSVLEWQPTNFWRLSGNYNYSRNNARSTAESPANFANHNEMSLGFRYSKANGKSIESTVRYVNIEFAGEENTAMGYELLQGLKPGDNFTWRLNWQQELFNGMQLHLSYEGRKSGDLKTIHVGRMQVMALF